jgi:hypothetical protein
MPLDIRAKKASPATDSPVSPLSVPSLRIPNETQSLDDISPSYNSIARSKVSDTSSSEASLLWNARHGGGRDGGSGDGAYSEEMNAVAQFHAVVPNFVSKHVRRYCDNLIKTQTEARTKVLS